MKNVLTGKQRVFHFFKETLFFRLFVYEAMFLLIAKTLFKICVFFFMVMIARYFSQEEFGDFQFVVGVINMLSQPAIIIALIVARIGCGFTANSRLYNLRWFLNKTRKHLFWVFFAITGMFFLIDPWLAKLATIKCPSSFTIAGIMIAVVFIFNFFIGILQSLEYFHIIGLVFVSAGILYLAQGFMIIHFNLGILYIYGAQALAISLVVMSMIYILSRILPEEAVVPETLDFSVPRLSIITVASLCVFFILYNMDIIAAKLFFDRTIAGYYGRLAFLGKINFLLASSLAVVFFPKVSKAYDRGENLILFLVKGSFLFLGFSLFAFFGIMLFAKYASHLVFGSGFAVDMRILFLVLVAGIFQSYLFMLINYGAASIDNGVTYCMLGVLALQIVLFSLNHATLLRIVSNMLISSIIGSVFLLVYVLRSQLFLTGTHGREKCRVIGNSSNL